MTEEMVEYLREQKDLARKELEIFENSLKSSLVSTSNDIKHESIDGLEISIINWRRAMTKFSTTWSLFDNARKQLEQ